MAAAQQRDLKPFVITSFHSDCIGNATDMLWRCATAATDKSRARSDAFCDAVGEIFWNHVKHGLIFY